MKILTCVEEDRGPMLTTHEMLFFFFFFLHFISNNKKQATIRFLTSCAFSDSYNAEEMNLKILRN